MRAVLTILLVGIAVAIVLWLWRETSKADPTQDSSADETAADTARAGPMLEAAGAM